MKNKLAAVYILSCLISISTALAFSQEPKCKRVLIIFSADWCNPCQQAKDDMNNHKVLSEIIKNYEIIDIDFDVDKDIVTGYNIKTIPAFVVFEDGNELKRKTGYNGPNKLIEFLK
jgi:thioredoxin 1